MEGIDLRLVSIDVPIMYVKETICTNFILKANSFLTQGKLPRLIPSVICKAPVDHLTKLTTSKCPLPVHILAQNKSLLRKVHQGGEEMRLGNIWHLKQN